MLKKTDCGVYYLKEYTKGIKGEYKDTLKSILDLRDNKKEAINYYLNLLEEKLMDYNLEDFHIATSVPNNEEGYISEGMAKLLKKLSEKYDNLEYIQCLNREENTINACHNDLEDKNIILFDYLATKGTSLNACKETLKFAKANLVVCIALEKAED